MSVDDAKADDWLPIADTVIQLSQKIGVAIPTAPTHTPLTLSMSRQHDWSPDSPAPFVGGYRRASSDPSDRGVDCSTYSYDSLNLADRGSGETIDVTVGLRNTSGWQSREVLQLCASCPSSRIKRPVQWPVSFAAADAAPGQAVTINHHGAAPRIRALGRASPFVGGSSSDDRPPSWGPGASPNPQHRRSMNK
jgi:hypothetical protein